MNFGNKIGLFVMTSFLLGLMGCTTPTLYQTTNTKALGVENQIRSAKVYDAYKPAEPTHSYSAELPMGSYTRSPNWLAKPISIHGSSLPFDFYVNKILANSGMNIAYQADLIKNIMVSMDYTGSARGALDNLAAQTGYMYQLQGKTLLWSDYITKTFDVSFMPGAAQYLMGEQGHSGSSSTSTTTVTGSSNSQFSNLQGTLSVWADLEKTIKDMLSKDGKVMVSQATTTITVRDHPQNVRIIGDYLNSMNKDLSRQVALQVEVLQVNLNKAFSYGINWNVIAGDLHFGGIPDANSNGTGFPLGNDLASLGGGAGGMGPGVGALSFGLMNNSGHGALINALEQQGTVSVVTQPRVVTLNNQVAQIGITNQQTYLASITTTSTAQVGSQTSLTPGTVSTGFTLFVLPKIQGDDVFLQLTSVLSSLDGLQTFSDKTNPNDPNANQIQGPSVSSKSFNQRSRVPSGSTLILAGFKQLNNLSNKAAYFGSDLLGGKGAQQLNTETIVLITPVIVGNL